MSIADGSVYNGMPATDLGEHGWERPWSGPNGGQCVETKLLADGRIAVRQSTDPAGPALIYTPEEIGAFVQGVKQGLADHLTAGSGSGRARGTGTARDGKGTGHPRPRPARHTAVHLLKGTG